MKILQKNEKISFGLLSNILRVLLLLMLAIILVASYCLPRMLITGDAAEYYSRYIFRITSFVSLAISGFFYNSLTELFIVVGSICILLFLIFFIVDIVATILKQDLKHALYKVYKLLRNVLIIGIVAALVFEANHGINYNRLSVREQMHLYGEERSLEEYTEALNWAYEGMINARRKLGEDYHGVSHMSTNFDAIVYDANGIVNAVSNHYDLGMSDNYIRAKAVSLSRLWTYTWIAGAYDPFLCEANINTDYLDILDFPVTVCHELCHAKGYASETDANTIAVLSCINSPRADFRYAGYYYIFNMLYSIVSGYSQAEGVEMMNYLELSDMDMVRRDEIASTRYYESLNKGPIADFIALFSEEVNNAFLESNGQDGGTKTYRVPQNVFVEYYFRYIVDA